MKTFAFSMDANVVHKDACPQKQKRKSDVKFLDSLDQFGHETTFHGVRYIFKRNAFIVRRILWIVMFVGCVSICLWQISNAVQQYFRYDTVNTVSIMRHSSLKLPAVSICNINQIRRSYAEALGSPYTEILGEYLYQSQVSSSVIENLDFTAMTALAGAINATFRQFIHTSAHQASNTFLRCYYWQDFDCLPYTQPVRTAKGLCYTFNGKNQSLATLESSFAGPHGGIALILNVDIDEYFAPILGDGVGFMITMHEPDDYPLLDHGGILMLAPGVDHFLSVRKQVVHYLKRPYSQVNCNDDPAYSYSVCRTDCLTRNVFECGTCSISSGTDEECSFLDGAICYLTKYTAWVNGEVECDCPEQCKRTLYNYQLSTAQYPNQYAVRFSEALPQWPFNTSDDVRRNALRLKIYYETISTEVVKEQPVLNQWQLFSTIGGLIGLFIGCSTITLCEVPDFLFVYLGRKLRMCNAVGAQTSTSMQKSGSTTSSQTVIKNLD